MTIREKKFYGGVCWSRGSFSSWIDIGSAARRWPAANWWEGVPVVAPGPGRFPDRAPYEPLSADAIGPKMARLHREHHRLLGNGHCTRPQELDCAFESICESCGFFQISIELRPTLQAQHDDAEAKGLSYRAALFDRLLTDLTEGAAS